MKSVTGREIFDAIKKNGWDWVREEYIDYDPITGEVYGACAIGQADLNLGVSMEKTFGDWAVIHHERHPFMDYLNKITTFNDEEVSHNHIWKEDDDWDIYHSDEECEITYHTYEEIVAFAEEVLTPVFDTVFEFKELGFTPR